jgi:hypothetical protein
MLRGLDFTAIKTKGSRYSGCLFQFLQRNLEMETYNTSVSPQSAVRQSSRRFGRFGHEDRDEIKRRAEADFLNLYVEFGGRRRGKALHCIFHEDRTPSARFYKRRFWCFTCDDSMDVIKFVQRVLGTDFKRALSYLSDRYCVPLHSWRLPPDERARYAQQQRDLDRDLPAALCWKCSALSMAEGVLAKLKAPLSNPEVGPVELNEILRFEGFLLRLRRLQGADLVDEYRRWAKDCRLTHGMVNAAELGEVADLLALETYWAMMERQRNGRV